MPFQTSVSVKLRPALSTKSPTALQSVEVGHETPRSSLPLASGGLGVGWIAQVEPSHRTANVSVPEGDR
jgi:hypothetical protein